MKIRNGFVSNSSSSSFIICGINIGEDNYTEEDINKIDKANLEYIIDDYTFIVGDILTYFSDDCGIQEIESIDISDKKEIYKKILEIYPNAREEDIKIYAGTVMS